MLQNIIIPAKQINEFQIGWTFDQLKPHLKGTYTIENYEIGDVIRYQNFGFFIFAETQNITKISVFDDYKGTYQGIGIGSTIVDIIKQFGACQEELSTYNIPNCEGLCFELADNETEEEWIEEEAPIESITVYNPEKVTDPNIAFNMLTGEYSYKPITRTITFDTIANNKKIAV